eukprot:scaffold172609_cov43-Prasinocladus_malaysianus.AAC.1
MNRQQELFHVDLADDIVQDSRQLDETPDHQVDHSHAALAVCFAQCTARRASQQREESTEYRSAAWHPWVQQSDQQRPKQGFQ